jgi:hypothetical protein
MINCPTQLHLVGHFYKSCESIQGEQSYSSTLTSGLDGCQWLTSHPAQFNPGKESLYSRASLVIVAKRKIVVSTTIRTLDHPDGTDHDRWLDSTVLQP